MSFGPFLILILVVGIIVVILRLLGDSGRHRHHSSAHHAEPVEDSEAFPRMAQDHNPHTDAAWVCSHDSRHDSHHDHDSYSPPPM